MEGLEFKNADASKYHLWDKILINFVNQALREAKQSYSDMKFRNIIVIFNNMLTIKENYLIARGGQKNPFVLLRYVEAILTIMNPIAPHFCQFVYHRHYLSVLRKSKNF